MAPELQKRVAELKENSIIDKRLSHNGYKSHRSESFF